MTNRLMVTTSFDPTAVSYYERLDVTPESDAEQIEKAGQIAFSGCTTEEEFDHIKQARTVLQTDDLRQAYQQFCDALGPIDGTYEFETWISDGRQVNVDERISQYQGSPRSGGVDFQELISELSDITQLTIETKTPKVIWRNNAVPPNTYINLWQKHDQRLYVNGFHEAGDIYLDLELGQFYTEDHEIISDISWDVIEQGRQLYVTYGDRRLTIDFVEDESTNQSMSQDKKETPTEDPLPNSSISPGLSSTTSSIINLQSLKLAFVGLVAAFGLVYIFSAIQFWLNVLLAIS